VSIVVYLSSWLLENGFSTQLLNRYKKSNWLYSIGTGARMRVSDKPTYEGELNALRDQAKLSIHVEEENSIVFTW